MINRNTYIKDQSNIKHHIAMYGGGTQSTGMILKALEDGEKLDSALFVDTGAEPQHVIEYVEYFSKYVLREFGFIIDIIGKGNLDNDIREYLNGDSKRVSQIPLYSETGILMRQCTFDYKIAPSDKYIKMLCVVYY